MNQFLKGLLIGLGSSLALVWLLFAVPRLGVLIGIISTGPMAYVIGCLIAYGWEMLDNEDRVCGD
jgi:hypothetical protein